MIAALLLALLAPGSYAAKRPRYKTVSFADVPRTRPSRREAIASKVDASLHFKLAGPVRKSKTGLTLRGYLTNSSDEAVPLIVFPVSDCCPFYLELAAHPKVKLIQVRPPLPPVPPSPMKFTVPARTRIKFSYTFDLSSYRYIGSPKVQLKWLFHYWNEPIPRGSLSAHLPRRNRR